MDYHWHRKEADPVAIASLQHALGMSTDLVATLFVQRGITTFDVAAHFMNPKWEHLHDPFLMKGMDKAVARIGRAMEQQERILVYGDYDVDGTTSVALVYGFLKRYYPHLDYYVPDRYKEGYGISRQGMDYAANSGCTLVVALDCGIKDTKSIAHARELGVDVIVCDHHVPGEILPPAVAILDPLQDGCDYPCKVLSGCGIGFKLLQALVSAQGWPEEALKEVLDLPAISIACDIVPITGENRVLCALGLEKINRDPLPGVSAMMETATLKGGDLDVTVLVFRIGPRINAAGRMDDARNAVRLLLGEAGSELMNHARLLKLNNEDRQDVDRLTTEQALAQLEADPDLDMRFSTVVYQSDWHKGVIGIVASRLIERHYKPTIVFTGNEDGMLAGSARSVNGFNLYEALCECEGLLEQFGGHFYAAGMKLHPDRLDAFRERFETVVRERITEESRQPRIEIDYNMPLHMVPDFGSKLWNHLKRFEPHGPGNMRPVFLAEGVRKFHEAREVGQGHLRLVVELPGGRNIAAIGFGLADRLADIDKGAVDICYSLSENTWNNRTSLQMEIKDIREAGV
jgi:single-stranded-DNA-specific exonuclease